MTDPRKKNEHHVDLHLAKLRAKFISHKPYQDLQEQFDRLLRRRRAAIELNIPTEARGIAVIGGSGSGKTTLVDRLFENHPDLKAPRKGDETAEIIRLLIPTPATLKHVGSTALTALGYPLSRDKPAAFIWDQVRHLLRKRRTLFVHLDEAQDLYTSNSPLARNAVVNTLKSLMNNKDWPVGLVLSGMPKVIDMINSDDQLKRRFYVVNLGAITWGSHRKDITEIFSNYLDMAGLSGAADLSKNEFLLRLVHAGANEFGLIIEVILAGIEEALFEGSIELRSAHFSEAFRRKSGCGPTLNPFIASDYLAIDTRAVLTCIPFQNGGSR